MKSISRIAIVVITLLTLCRCTSNIENKNEQPYLIILSLDGFRWDYPEKANTPTFDSLQNVGASSESIKACFPTKTFPNHFAIATGLYPDNHGIVLNDFHAVDLGVKYEVRNREAVQDGRFYNGTPIWNAAENNGITSATLFWVGSSADIQGTKPTNWSPYNEELSQESRIDTLVNWLEKPKRERPHLILWYYHEPDGIGHGVGPESEEIIPAIENLDSFVGNFFTAMRKLPDFEKYNFIITSDHGMGQISEDRTVYLDKIVDTSLFDIIDGSNPVYNLKVKNGNLDKAYESLKISDSNFKVWKHGELPEHLNYGNNIRTLDLTVVADSAWSISWSWLPKYGSKGTHGYENTNKDMNAIFFAAGPAFKRNYIHPQFNNIDIYPLMCEILQIDIPENDGKLENVIGLLK